MMASLDKDAEALLVQLLHQRDLGIDAPPGKLTTAEFLAQWLESYAKPNTAPKTYLRYEEIVRIHLTPSLGATALTKVRPLHVQKTYAQLLAKGLSARSVLHCHRVLKGALSHAIKWQLMSRNPADAVDPPTPVRYEVKAVEAEQVKVLLAAADATRFGPFYNLAVMTGLRVGELLGLRWRDVDLDHRVLSVRQTCQWLPREGFIFRQPKTYRSTRPVSLGGA